MKTKISKRGFALAFSLIVMTSVILFVEIFFSAAGSELKIANRTADSKRAYYLAEAGLADAFMQFKNNPNVPSPIDNNAYNIGNKTGSYHVDFMPDGAAWPTYTFTSTGTYGSTTKTLELRVQQKVASNYAYLSNSEIHPSLGTLWWITGMYTVGPVHTNGQFNIWGNPIFDGPVSQSSSSIHYWPGVYTDPASFRGGLTLSAPTQAVFNSIILNNISSAASANGGLYLSGNSAITFNANGTINVTNSARGWNNRNMSLPSNKAIYVNNGSVTVNGTISGQATIGTNKTIYIANNLMYNTNPDPTHQNLASTDLLALVAQNDIVVKSATAPANVVIEAVMVAISGSFRVDNWWVQGKGDMLQYGALINNVCGPTGVFDPGTGTLYGGYNQLQYYDERLQFLVPPCFPALRDASGQVTYHRLSFREY